MKSISSCTPRGDFFALRGASIDGISRVKRGRFPRRAASVTTSWSLDECKRLPSPFHVVVVVVVVVFVDMESELICKKKISLRSSYF